MIDDCRTPSHHDPLLQPYLSHNLQPIYFRPLSCPLPNTFPPILLPPRHRLIFDCPKARVHTFLSSSPTTPIPYALLPNWNPSSTRVQLWGPSLPVLSRGHCIISSTGYGIRSLNIFSILTRTRLIPQRAPPYSLSKVAAWINSAESNEHPSNYAFEVHSNPSFDPDTFDPEPRPHPSLGILQLQRWSSS